MLTLEYDVWVQDTPFGSKSLNNRLNAIDSLKMTKGEIRLEPKKLLFWKLNFYYDSFKILLWLL
jgi:hypothetical protein